MKWLKCGHLGIGQIAHYEWEEIRHSKIGKA